MQLLSFLTLPVRKEVARSVSSRTEPVFDPLWISDVSSMMERFAEVKSISLCLLGQKSQITCPAGKAVQCLLCDCVGLETLHQRADGMDSSGHRPLVRDDVYSPGTTDIFIAGLALRPKDGVTHQC